MRPLPQFPEFAPIDAEVCGAIERFSRQFPPYGTFLPSLLWAYGTERNIGAAIHGKNLVVRFDNAITGHVAYTFLGDEAPAETATALLELLDATHAPAELHLITEETAKRLSTACFHVRENRDGFEYLLDVPALATYEGGRFSNLRYRVNRFWRRRPTARVEQVRCPEPSFLEALADLYARWDRNQRAKHFAPARCIWGSEYGPLTRLLTEGGAFDCFGVGIWLDQQLIAFGLGEYLGRGYGVFHFTKADATAHPDSFSVLLQEMAKVLDRRGCTLVNFQEDAGLPQLRYAKERYRPVGFLKTYIVGPSLSPSNFRVGSAGIIGRGLFAERAFRKHELVFVMEGERHIYRSRTAEDAHRYENWITIGRDLFLDPAEPYVYVNHSCNPNLGIRGENEFIAIRDIRNGEELAYDYSITTDERPWTMQCLCGNENCRGIIRSVQYLPPSVLSRYLPYVSTYIRGVYLWPDTHCGQPVSLAVAAK